MPGDKKVEVLDLQGLPSGGDSWTRTNDPIDVNDVLSAPGSFVREIDEVPTGREAPRNKPFPRLVPGYICTQRKRYIFYLYLDTYPCVPCLYLGTFFELQIISYTNETLDLHRF